MRKHPGSLRAVDDDGEDVLRRVKLGDLVTVEIKRSRHLKRFRLFWVVIGMVFDNQTHYTAKEHLVTALKIRLGHCDWVPLPHTGELVPVPKSIAFNNMEEDDFTTFMDKVFDVIAAEFLPTMPVNELRAEVARIVGAS